MSVASESRELLLKRLQRLLRWKLWVQERLQLSEWQVTLLWAAAAGFLGSLTSLLFSALAEGVHEVLTGSSAGVVDSMRLLPWWGRMLVPTLGGAAAGLVLLYGQRLTRAQSSTDYMEAIAIGNGELPVRASLVKSTAALFSIGSGGSIGREGPMVQLAAVAASLIGRWRKFTGPQLRLIVACGASAGIASAYNAPIGGSFFIAEIILGSIAMESLGPLAVSAVVATLTIRVLTSAQVMYKVPAFQLNSAWEMGPYVILGLVTGSLAPAFLRSLKQSEEFFISLKLPLVLRLALGGLAVGVMAINVPQICGNGYSVVVQILNGPIAWKVLLGIFACKWLATMASFGSGAPGGVFTPSLFMGASVGYLFGGAVHAVWPVGAMDPGAFALVGMGSFLAAASRAPVMAIIMLFEMTLSYDIILPLMLCSVIAYYTAKGIQGSSSLYSESLKRKAATDTTPPLPTGDVLGLIKADPPVIRPTARFAAIAQMFLSVRVNNLYVCEVGGRFLGAVSLHDIKPYLGQLDLAELVIARDILREDFPRIGPHQSLSDALGLFLAHPVERLPVVDPETGNLRGSVAKTDLLLALVEKRRKPA